MGLTFNMTLNRAFECFNVVSSAIYLTNTIRLHFFKYYWFGNGVGSCGVRWDFDIKTFAMKTMAAIKKTFGLKKHEKTS